MRRSQTKFIESHIKVQKHLDLLPINCLNKCINIKNQRQIKILEITFRRRIYLNGQYTVVVIKEKLYRRGSRTSVFTFPVSIIRYPQGLPCCQIQIVLSRSKTSAHPFCKTLDPNSIETAPDQAKFTCNSETTEWTNNLVRNSIVEKLGTKGPSVFFKLILAILTNIDQTIHLDLTFHSIVKDCLR